MGFLHKFVLLAPFYFSAALVLSQEEVIVPEMQIPLVVSPLVDVSPSMRLPEPPSIVIDLPLSVGINRTFELDVWLDTSKHLESKVVEVSLEQTNRMSYDPRIFSLTPGLRKTVHARVLDSPSGLAEIAAAVDGWATQPIIIDAGFSGYLKSDLGDSIESGEVKSFSLEFTDHNGASIRLDTPTRLKLQVTSALLRHKNDEHWTDRLEVPLERGASSTPLLQVMSDSLSGDTGLLLAQLAINDKYVIHSDKFHFTVLPRWWLPLLMAILGALLYTLYETTRTVTANRRYSFRLFLRRGLPRIVTGILAGILSYFLASYNILGVDIKTTSLRGFVILGFLFSYVGIDLILNKLVPTETQKNPDPPTPLG